MRPTPTKDGLPSRSHVPLCEGVILPSWPANWICLSCACLRFGSLHRHHAGPEPSPPQLPPTGSRLMWSGHEQCGAFPADPVAAEVSETRDCRDHWGLSPGPGAVPHPVSSSTDRGLTQRAACAPPRHAALPPESSTWKASVIDQAATALPNHQPRRRLHDPGLDSQAGDARGGSSPGGSNNCK